MTNSPEEKYSIENYIYRPEKLPGYNNYNELCIETIRLRTRLARAESEYDILTNPHMTPDPIERLSAVSMEKKIAGIQKQYAEHKVYLDAVRGEVLDFVEQLPAIDGEQVRELYNLCTFNMGLFRKCRNLLLEKKLIEEMRQQGIAQKDDESVDRSRNSLEEECKNKIKDINNKLEEIKNKYKTGIWQELDTLNDRDDI